MPPSPNRNRTTTKNEIDGYTGSSDEAGEYSDESSVPGNRQESLGTFDNDSGADRDEAPENQDVTSSERPTSNTQSDITEDPTQSSQGAPGSQFNQEQYRDQGDDSDTVADDERNPIFRYDNPVFENEDLLEISHLPEPDRIVGRDEHMQKVAEALNPGILVVSRRICLYSAKQEPAKLSFLVQ